MQMRVSTTSHRLMIVHCVVRSIFNFFISVCTEQLVLVGASLFFVFSGSSCLALVSKSAVAMQVVVSERLS